ncbi:MAG: 2-oxo-4-hydroxy-4-carboxy-5-ureidoimidazoline decarboxylase [Pseudomonadota bacterium]
MSLTINDMNQLPRDAFVAQFGGIFESSPWVAERIADARPFSSIGVLHDAMVAAVRAAPAHHQDELIRAHPDLAGKAARAGELTEASTKEQAGAGLSSMSDEQYDQFEELNNAYREKFGLPFIIAVRGYTVDGILNEFRRRLWHDLKAERETALQQIARIARFRLNDLLDEASPEISQSQGGA